MASRLSELPPADSAGRPPLYPYDEWFDGSPWLALHGEDYTCTTEGFLRSLRREATSRGIKVATRKTLQDKTEAVAFQVITGLERAA